MSEALTTAAGQCCLWASEWQAKEQEADKAIAEGRVRTCDTIDRMLEFLDKERNFEGGEMIL